MIKNLKAVALTTALTGAFVMSAGAQAGDDNSLQTWAKKASYSVDKAMVYPKFAERRGEEGTSQYRITIDRDGDVVDSNVVRRTGARSIKAASNRLIKRLDLPALPASYEGETLTIALRLNYAIASSAQEAKNLMRQGRVTGREVASDSGPMVASIAIVDSAVAEE